LVAAFNSVIVFAQSPGALCANSGIRSSKSTRRFKS